MQRHLREPEADWVRVVARASLPRLHYGMIAIVDRSDPRVRKQIRAGHLVVLAEEPEPEDAS